MPTREELLAERERRRRAREAGMPASPAQPQAQGLTLPQLQAEQARRKQASRMPWGDDGASFDGLYTLPKSVAPPAPRPVKGPPAALPGWRPDQLASAQRGAQPGASAADRLNAQTRNVALAQAFSDIKPAGSDPAWKGPEAVDPQLDRIRKEKLLTDELARSGTQLYSGDVQSLLDMGDPAIERIVSREQLSSADNRPFMSDADFNRLTPERQQQEADRMARVSAFDQTRRQDAETVSNLTSDLSAYRASRPEWLNAVSDSARGGVAAVDRFFNNAIAGGMRTVDPEGNVASALERSGQYLGGMLEGPDNRFGNNLPEMLGGFGYRTGENPYQGATEITDLFEPTHNIAMGVNDFSDAVKKFSAGDTAGAYQSYMEATPQLLAGAAMVAPGAGPAINRAYKAAEIASASRLPLNVNQARRAAVNAEAARVRPQPSAPPPRNPREAYNAMSEEQRRAIVQGLQDAGMSAEEIVASIRAGRFSPPPRPEPGPSPAGRQEEPQPVEEPIPEPEMPRGGAAADPASARAAPAPFSAAPEPLPPRRGFISRNADTIFGGGAGAYLGGVGEANAADENETDPEGNPAVGAGVGGAIGMAIPRIGRRFTGQVARTVGRPFNPRGYDERIVAGAIRRDLRNVGITNADEAAAAMAMRFGDKPSTIADLTQEGINKAAGLSRLPGETPGKARIRYEELGDAQKGRLERDIASANPNLNPGTITGNIDEMIQAAREQATPAYNALRANYPELDSPRLRVLLDMDVMRPHVEAANAYATTVRQTTGRQLTDFEIMDLIKRNMDAAEQKLIARPGASMDDLQIRQIEEARSAFVRELDQLMPEYAAARKAGGEAPIMKADFEKGQRLLEGRYILEDVTRIVTGITDRPLTALQAGVIRSMVAKAQNTRGAVQALSSSSANKKLAAVFGQEAADAMQARFKADAAIMQNAGRINPNVGSVTGQALMGGGGFAADAVAAIRALRNPTEAGLSWLSKAGAYSEAQRDLMGQMLLEGATPENLARIFPPRGRRGGPPRPSRRGPPPRRSGGPSAGPGTSGGPPPSSASGGATASAADQTAATSQASSASAPGADALKRARDLIAAVDAGGVPSNPIVINNIARSLGFEVEATAAIPDTIKRIRDRLDELKSGTSAADDFVDTAGMADDVAAPQARDVGDIPFPAQGAPEVPEWTGPRPKKPQSLLAWIRSQGGIKDTNYMTGDLKAIMGRANAYPGLLNNKSGTALDLLARRAYSEGFDVDPEDANTLMRLIDEEFRGDPSYRIGAREEWDAYQDYLRQADRYEADRAPDTMGFGGRSSPAGARAVQQAQSQGYAGRDIGEAQEWVRAREKGLDMSQEGRMARAQKMGFDVETPLYHGTATQKGERFKSFDPGMLGSRTNLDEDKYAAAGVYLTKSKADAGWYADRAESRMKPDYVNDTYPKAWTEKYYVRGRILTASDDAASKGEVIEKAKREGYDGVYMPYGLGQDPDDTFIIFNPANIRSVNAAFDPDFLGSSNILAGMGRSPVATGAFAGGTAGAVAPYDSDGDGQISANERAASVMGGMISGGIGGAAAGRLMPGMGRKGPPPRMLDADMQSMGIGGGRGRPADGNRHSLSPAFRVVAPVLKNPVPRELQIVQKATPQNAARVVANIDNVLASNPTPEASTRDWAVMLSKAFGDSDVPVPPITFIEDMKNSASGAIAKLKTLSPSQIKHADMGFKNAAEFRDLYQSGKVTPATTGKLFAWSFLSRGVNPYTQESMFIDVFNGIDDFIDKAYKGQFDSRALKDYLRWASKQAGKGSGLPGSGTKHNLNAFGTDFLTKMGAMAPNGKTHLANLHDMLGSEMTGPQIRRAFLTDFPSGIGIDNKVISFTLLVSGRSDVMVIDRVQMRALWNDYKSAAEPGRYGRENIYDNLKVNKKPVAGTGLAEITYGPRGILVYEAIERALSRQIDNIYAAVGRPSDASIGRYHWDTWNAASGQEAGHGSLYAILNQARRSNSPLDGVFAKNGEYGEFTYGAEYGRRSDGSAFFRYSVPNGGTYTFNPKSFNAFIQEVKKARSGVVPSKFKVSESGNAPWFERSEVNTQALDALAARFADKAGRASQAALRNAPPSRSAGRGAGGGRAQGATSLGPPPKNAKGPRTTLSAFPGADEPSIKQGPAFYSALSRAVESNPTARAPAAQWKATLARTPGVKAEEIEVTGVNDWLDLQTGPVTKQQLQEYLDANGVRVEDVVFGASDDMVTADRARIQQELLSSIERRDALANEGDEDIAIFGNEIYRIINFRNPPQNPFESIDQALMDGSITPDTYQQIKTHVELSLKIDELEASMRELSKRDETRWSTFTLPGGENYREVLLKLPVPQELAFDPSKVKFNRNQFSASQGGVQISYDGKDLGTFDLFTRDQSGPRDAFGQAISQRPRTDDEIIEIARKYYEQGNRLMNIKPLRKGTFTSSHWDDPNVLAHIRFKERTTPDGRRILAIEEIQSDWHRDGRKRGYLSAGEMRLRELNEKSLGWRFVERETGKAVENAEVAEWRALQAQFGESLKQKATGVPDAPFKNNAWVQLVLKRAIRYAAEGGFDEIAWIPGKVQNGKIVQASDNRAAFYDKIVVDAANKLGKKYNASVGRIDMSDDVGMPDIVFHSLPITPALKKRALEGQSLFSFPGGGAGAQAATGAGAAAYGYAMPQDFNDDGAIDDTDRGMTAGLYGLGGLTAAGLARARNASGRGAVPDGATTRTFGGENAKTADKRLLGIAKQMEKAGGGRDQIWRETGWGRSRDGKWRFEIDDSKSGFRLDRMPEEGRTTSLGNVLEHEDAYAAYPTSRDIQVVEDPNTGRSGAFFPGADMISLRSRGLGAGGVKSTALHEHQHVIQEKEGFASGGSPQHVYMSDELRPEWMRQVDRQLTPPTYEQFAANPTFAGVPKSEVRRQYNGMVKDIREARKDPYHPLSRAAQESAARDIYRRLAGEVEARNVQIRRNMTPYERRANPPWTTQDVPDDQQIVRMLGGPQESSLGPPKSSAMATQEPVQPPPVKGPPGSSSIGRMIGGGAIGGALGAMAGEAEADSSSEIEQQLQAEMAKIAQLNKEIEGLMADQNFFRTADNKELQRRLAREGFNLGPTGVDGILSLSSGRETLSGKAIREFKANIEERLNAANERLNKAEGQVKVLMQRDALQRNRPNFFIEAAREYGPTMAGILVGFGMKYMRGSAAKASVAGANAASQKLNRLITPISKQEVTGMLNRADESRPANLNQLWQKGGAKKDELPFLQDSVGKWKPNPNARPADELFQDDNLWKQLTRYVKGKDLAWILGSGGEAALMQPLIDKANEDLVEAERVWKDNPSDETYKRVEDAKNAVANYTLLQRLGMGVAGGRIIGSIGAAYAKPQPNIVAAATEQAALKQYIASTKPPPKPRGPRKPKAPPPVESPKAQSFGLQALLDYFKSGSRKSKSPPSPPPPP